MAGEQKTNMDLGPVFANMVGGKVFERGLKNLTRTDRDDGVPLLLSSKSYRFSIYIIDYTGSNAFAENLVIELPNRQTNGPFGFFD